MSKDTLTLYLNAERAGIDHRLRPVPDTNGVAFMSDPLPAATTIRGAFSGDHVPTCDVRDVDVGVVLYELTSAAKYIQLSFYCYVKRGRHLTTA